MAGTALLALQARVVTVATMAGRLLRELRVVFLGAGSENVRGLRREARVNMRDTVMLVGGRCHLIASDAIRRGKSGGLWVGI